MDELEKDKQPMDREHDRFTIQFVARECSQCRAHLVDFYSGGSGQKPVIARKDTRVLPEEVFKDLMKMPANRLMAREAMTRLHRIAIGCEEGILRQNLVVKMEGTFIANTAVFWMHFLVSLRREKGFETAYSPLLRLVGEIARERIKEHGRDNSYWEAVLNWSANPEDTAPMESAASIIGQRPAPPDDGRDADDLDASGSA